MANLTTALESDELVTEIDVSSAAQSAPTREAGRETSRETSRDIGRDAVRDADRGVGSRNGVGDGIGSSGRDRGGYASAGSSSQGDLASRDRQDADEANTER